MRLWSLHPKYLDSRGLVALWREALLAQAVLAGKTRGYTKHPQLERFKSHARPLEAIGGYLAEVQQEAKSRGYKFDRGKILAGGGKIRIAVTSGQLEYEWLHLKKKLKVRDGAHLEKIAGIKLAEAHPVFAIRKGKAEGWEKIKKK